MRNDVSVQSDDFNCDETIHCVVLTSFLTFILLIILILDLDNVVLNLGLADHDLDLDLV